METATICIDVPETATADAATEALAGPGDGFFLVQVLPVPGAHRAYFRRYKQAPPTKAETAQGNLEAIDHAAALSVVRANRDKPVRTIVTVLAAAGIKRGKDWVSEQLDATCAEDGREDDALRMLKLWPRDTPADVVYFLKVNKIRRSTAWVRRKREELAQDVCADKS